MSNPYYDHGSFPQTGAAGSSASMRAELESIEAGFNKLPILAGNGGKILKIKSAEDGIEVSIVFSDNGTNGTVSGDLIVAGGNLGIDADSLHTLPNVAADVFALLAAAQTFTNKTIVVANNVITTAASGNLAATELNAALSELQTDLDTRATSTDLSNHINDATDAHDASAISFTPAGGIVATDVQSAIAEVDADLTSHLNDTADAHDASAISYAGSTNLVADNVESALDELDSEKAGLATTNTFTSANRTVETTDNDGSFDLNAALDFKCTPTAGFALTFTNIPATPGVQKGTILLDNSGGYTITAAATTKVGASLLSTISVAGIYTLGYRSSNGNVYVTSSGAQA
jgi:hypothetical protein